MSNILLGQGVHKHIEPWMISLMAAAATALRETRTFSCVAAMGRF
jgi:hypothetical protein